MTTDPIAPDSQAQLPRFDARMSDAEGLMWRLEKDPFLASTFGNVTVVDKPLNFALFKERLDRATMAVPRLRQRVRPTPAALGAPRWVDDPEFNIDFHVRHHAVPPPGTPEQLAEVVSRIVARPLDRARRLTV